MGSLFRGQSRGSFSWEETEKAKRGQHCEVLALPCACFYFEILQAKRIWGLSVRSILGTWEVLEMERQNRKHLPDHILDVAGTIHDIMGR